MTVTLTPNPASPASTVTIEGAGFTPKLKIRIKDAGDVWRSRADGGFSVGLVVSTTPKTQTVVLQQQVSGAWVTSWSGTVVVQNVVVPPPPEPPPVTPPTTSGPITVTTHDRTIADLSFTGSGSGTAIACNGTVATPIRRLTIRRCVIKGFNAGIRLVNVAEVVIEDCTIDDSVYTGIMVIAAIGGRIERNTVRRVGMGKPALTNAYGITATNLGGDPQSQDVLIKGNTIEDVPTWEAMDTHGGRRITFEANIVRRSRRGVMLTGCTDAVVTGNQFLSPVSIPPGDQYAVAPVNSVNSQITGNTITGWGAGHDLIRTYPNPGLVFSGNVVTP